MKLIQAGLQWLHSRILCEFETGISVCEPFFFANGIAGKVHK